MIGRTTFVKVVNAWETRFADSTYDVGSPATHTPISAFLTDPNLNSPSSHRRQMASERSFARHRVRAKVECKETA